MPQGPVGRPDRCEIEAADIRRSWFDGVEILRLRPRKYPVELVGLDDRMCDPRDGQLHTHFPAQSGLSHAGRPRDEKDLDALHSGCRLDQRPRLGEGRNVGLADAGLGQYSARIGSLERCHRPD